ncbi:ABC transporter ATP-binding protein [Rhodopirellula sallentina]|uniref:Oligopeptide/dipeptide abc transporter, atpase subunit n=1 Tax=Rhodopirellula sallentina SM41 TaxID=1263870 RepID=M5TUU6_9BACT|nr:ABC transporter ATP-binding protein [Rhodopirellula sallentina]EMI52967.1 oligopeptide/dipeptide abc transporter, atpase subunit [Rhodopirellula sallentina SM41]
MTQTASQTDPTESHASDDPILRVDDLHVSFKTDEGMVRAVRGVSFDVRAGETVAIVGESGSGKSVTNLAMMGLVPKPPGNVDSGRALFGGRDLLTMSDRELQDIRGRHIAMIFQDPMTALNPLMTVEQQLTEMTRLHLSVTRHEARRHAIEMLGLVGITAPEKRLRDYPHQFSGGMRQRVMIAMALSCEPELLIADEPTTALDVTIQAQIMELLADLQERKGTAIVLITHDLGVVAGVADRVLVMYAGRIVEKADVRTLFAGPQHPYTIGLLGSLPNVESNRDEPLAAIPGQPPDLSQPILGCSFRDRCDHRFDRCQNEAPLLTPRADLGGEPHLAACHADLSNTDSHTANANHSENGQ